MKLDPTAVRQILEGKGVKFLYHANSVASSCTFLSNGLLLSRRQVERRGFLQTPQDSDTIDKKFKIWNDIFLDTVDIHDRSCRPNYYGPVLFIFSMDVLSAEIVHTVSVTLENPVHWHTRQQIKERYCLSTEKLQSEFHFGDFSKSLVLKDIEGILPLSGLLKGLIVDDPGPLPFRGGNRLVLEPALKALRSAARQGGLKNLRILVRKCPSYSFCKIAYSEDPFGTQSRFDPKYKPL
jgi:hypothetical protein